MTEIEWATIETLLENGWPGKFSAAQGDAYRVFLAHHPPELVLEALHVLALRGGSHRPSVAEIAHAVGRDEGRPTFDEAAEILFGRRGVVHAASAERALARADAAHAAVGAFVRVQGLDRLRRLPLDDPDWGHLERRRLAEAWDRHVEACDRRTATGRALEATGRAGQIGPRRLDPLGILPGLTPDRELESGEPG